MNPRNFISIHYCYLPLKSKFDIISKDEPFLLKIIKQSFEKTQSLGIGIDFLALRSDIKLLEEHKKRIKRDCFLEVKRILNIPSVEDIYCLPIKLLEYKEYLEIIKSLKINNKRKEGHIEKFNKINIKNNSKVLIIGETESSGSYLSLKEAVKHSLKSFKNKSNIKWIKGSEIDTININNYDFIIITEGKENLEGKFNIIKNSSVPILCIGSIYNKLNIKSRNCFFIKDHIEYRSKPMNPSLNIFFDKKWKKDY